MNNIENHLSIRISEIENQISEIRKELALHIKSHTIEQKRTKPNQESEFLKEIKRLGGNYDY